MGDLLQQVKGYNIRRRDPQPDKAALLIIDMQRYFEGIAAPIVENVIDLVEAARGAGASVFYTKHGHRDPVVDGGMLGEWWGDLIAYGSPDWELLPGLQPLPTEPVIGKNRYSAFADTTLEAQLRERGVEELIITGVMTNCCCETTARDAFVRDFRVFFAVDATATVDQTLQLASLQTLAYGFAYLDDTAGLLRAFRSRTAEVKPAALE